MPRSETGRPTAARGAALDAGGKGDGAAARGGPPTVGRSHPTRAAASEARGLCDHTEIYRALLQRH